MKKIFLFLFFIILTAVSIAQEPNYNTNTMKDSIVTDTLSGKPMLIGKCSRSAFNDSTFAWWFKPTYQIYTIDSTALKEVEPKLKDVNITIVMGTWCSDSKYQVPHFYKILDYLKYPTDKINLIMVNRKLKSVGDELKNLDIHSVPTIIFYKNGKELGRIIESPKKDLEKDMVKILG